MWYLYLCVLGTAKKDRETETMQVHYGIIVHESPRWAEKLDMYLSLNSWIITLKGKFSSACEPEIQRSSNEQTRIKSLFLYILLLDNIHWLNSTFT